ncbi:hypothetical protein ACPCK1_02785 [Streptomyces pseudogriseolus]|uniref:hypothetical protein n=1 Tax=Streptomyces pseudogriseolus TaxID=36817 RepID=UPI003FA3270E
MADRDDEVLNALAFSISQVYLLLVHVCRMLPVPIGLPVDAHIPASDAIPAIRRITEVAGEQPMGETPTLQLYSGCIHLLAAFDLYGLCSMSYHDNRADGVAALLLHSQEELESLEIWLMTHNQPHSD